MSVTKLKICGITRLEDARYCAAAGADLLGFIQHQASPRYIAPARVKEIAEWLYGPRTVGVFVDEDPDEVNRIAADCGFDYVQLHGSESPAYCSLIDTAIIKAIHIDNATTPGDVGDSVSRYADVAEYVLFDTRTDGAKGGTGVTFPWDIIRGLDLSVPFFLAGGISPENVVSAIKDIQPAGIDLSSSVESSPGIKDFDLLASFFDAFRSATAT